MPNPKTAAETTISRRIPRALDAELQALRDAIEKRPRGHVVPSAAELLVAAVRAGLSEVRAAYGQGGRRGPGSARATEGDSP